MHPTQEYILECNRERGLPTFINDIPLFLLTALRESRAMHNNTVTHLSFDMFFGKVNSCGAESPFNSNEYNYWYQYGECRSSVEWGWHGKVILSTEKVLSESQLTRIQHSLLIRGNDSPIRVIWDNSPGRPPRRVTQPTIKWSFATLFLADWPEIEKNVMQDLSIETLTNGSVSDETNNLRNLSVVLEP